MIYAIILIILGVLAASSVIIKNRPEAKDLINKLVPFQGWIGFICCIWGIWGIISMILNIGWLTTNPIWWSIAMAMSVITAALGLLLGFGLISQYVLSKNEAAMAKGDALRAKLVNYQIPMGFIAIGLGIFGLVWSIIY